MPTNTKLAPHEIIELREMLSTEIVGAKKIQASMAMVKDEELSSFMGRCLNSKKSNINTIQSFIENNTNVKEEGNGQCQF